MTSYVCSQEDVANFLNKPNMADQSGFLFAYESKLEDLQRLVPAPLEVKRPIVVGHIMHVEKPNFCEPYDEANLSILVSYKGTEGLYPLTNLVSGPGNQESVIAPREFSSMPKKFTNSIWIRKTGNIGHCEISRHGVTLINLNVDLGKKYEDGFSEVIARTKEKPVKLLRYYIGYDLLQAEDGKVNFAHTALLASHSDNTLTKFDSGAIELTLTSSVDDPVGELPVVKPLGGAWLHADDVLIRKTEMLEKLDAAKTAPYLITGHYDRAICEDEDTFLTF